MIVNRLIAAFAAYSHLTHAGCPMMGQGDHELPSNHPVSRRGEQTSANTEEHLSQYYLDDADAYLTSDAGGPMSDQDALKAGERGPTLLEDFINRQKVRNTCLTIPNDAEHHARSLISTMREFQREVSRSPTLSVTLLKVMRSCTRSWCRSTWGFRLLRRLVEHYRCFLSEHG
jgi:hypothetical protein